MDTFTSWQGKNSFLFSFEGIEGSGKSTQIKQLEQELKLNGYKVLCLREPGGTVFGEGLRSAILNSKTPINSVAEAYLFASSRAQLLAEKVIPYITQPNHIVILDRYIDSSIAYQGFARGLGMQKVLDIHAVEPLNLMPNLTFYLKIDASTSLQRQSKRGEAKDYFEEESLDFTNKLISGYDECALKFANRIKTIQGHQDQAKVTHDMIHALKEFLNAQ